ncbi:MAG: hypothetical protein A2V65_11515 [Deltaproteobacteria bacterium RBG_13_49_15]|nr:MAG: hypothetical protein A2V65_11515 [Deltaproteobacteria bacterium RBG_13_49_15]
MFLFFACSGSHAAESKSISSGSQITGRELAQKVYSRENGDDAVAQMHMILIDESGKERVREFTAYRKDFVALSRQVLRFTAPSDIQGTAFLSIEKTGGETEQFLFLPSLRRSRRIVSSQKSHRFVNSDFSYEDMERRPVDSFDHRIAGEEKIDSVECLILESTPKNKANSQYSLIKSWIAKDTDIPLKADHFDEKKELLKTYRVLEVKPFQNIKTETYLVMEDAKRRTKTVLTLVKISYNTGIKDDIFTQTKLENW